MDAYAELYGRVQRRLFAEAAAGGSAASLKSAYLKRHGIPARMFNAIRVSLDGKSASVREQQKLRLGDLRRRIARAERRFPMPPNMAGLIRFIRRNGGWPICGTGCLHWKPT